MRIVLNTKFSSGKMERVGLDQGLEVMFGVATLLASGDLYGIGTNRIRSLEFTWEGTSFAPDLIIKVVFIGRNSRGFSARRVVKHKHQFRMGGVCPSAKDVADLLINMVYAKFK